MLIGYLSLILRIVMLGAERIFLKKLEQYDSTTVASLFFLIATFFLSPVFLFLNPSDYRFPLLFMLFPLISSLFYSFGFFAYVKALSVGEASLVAPLYNSSILWLMIIGVLFLQEDVTVLRSFGATIMFVGLFFLYEGKVKDKLIAIKESKASIYMIIGSLFIAIGRGLDTFAIGEINEMLYSVFINFFVGLYLLIATIVRNQFKTVREIFETDPKSLIGAGIMNGWSFFFLLIAISELQVTVAEPLSLLSTFVTAFMARKFLQERIQEKLPGMVMMVTGSIVLVLS